MFANEWVDESYEKGESQSFWTELFAVFGINRRKVATFETRAKRLGGQGFIDVFWPGVMIAEQKSRGRDLVAAEQQAIDYLTSVSDAEYPRYIVTSDFGSFRIRDLEAPPGEEPVTFLLEDLPTECERLGFIAGYQKRSFGSEEQAAASIEAAQLMAGLYEELEKSGYDEHQSSIFLVRTLFALFADDSGLWERDLFLEYITTRTNEDGSDLGAQLSALYQALNKPEKNRLTKSDELISRFPYVNGSVFGETIDIPYFDRAMRDKLIAACYFNWGEISPAIFGSLFQAVKSKEARRELGEHYTTEKNILKLIGPLFLDEFQQRFRDKYNSATELLHLQEDMGRMRFLDPACGCGNFLIVSYREMRELELRIIVRRQELLSSRASQTMLILGDEDHLKVKMTNFFGIEIEEWPATIARTAMFLVNHQANQDMALKIGVAPEMLPLVESSTIVVANALTTNWSAVVPPSDDLVVLGNPPFLGHISRSTEQTEELKAVWKRNDIGRLDYVTGWYAKTLSYLGNSKSRWAFVSTNSITQGEPVPTLFQPVMAAGWRIRFAHRTFSWSSEAPGAAAVHCTILGFDRNDKTTARLFDYSDVKGDPTEIPAKNINPYLVDAPNVFVEQRRVPLSTQINPATFGNMPRDGGHLIVEIDEYNEVISDPVAAKYLRRYVGSRELLHGQERWCLWLENLDPNDVPLSSVLKHRLEAVKSFREKSSAASTRSMARTPHLFGQRSQSISDYVCIPSVVSETRPYFTVARLSSEIISSNLTFQCQDPDGFQFAIISSSMFITWQKTVGGRLKSDLRYSSTLTWNTLPLPALDSDLYQKVISAGNEILEIRALFPERSLASLYNPLAMPATLVSAHDKLDYLVDRAFGASKTCPDSKSRQEILFSRYAELTS